MAAGPIQNEIILKTIQVLDPGQPVLPPHGIVYSTNPRITSGTDGHEYFLKGTDRNVVVAEAVAHLLAKMLQVPVPEFGIAPVEEKFYFASRSIQIRNVEVFVERKDIANADVLARTIVLDVWFANPDRNMGNFVGEIAGNPGPIRLLPIDFEKSVCLRGPTPLVSAPMVNPKKLWPKERLGQLLRGTAIPTQFCDKVANFQEHHITDCFNKVVAHVGDIEWVEGSLKVLVNRAKQIHTRVQEAWS